MRSTILAATATALLSISVAADNCNHGLYYCGSSLLKKGNYISDIVTSLQNAGQPVDDAHIENGLFYCQGDDDVPLIAYCGSGCVDAGSGQSDYCV